MQPDKPLFGGPIMQACKGCSKIVDHFGIEWCSVYPYPDRIWARGECFFNRTKKEGPKRKVRVGQLKTKRNRGKLR